MLDDEQIRFVDNHVNFVAREISNNLNKEIKVNDKEYSFKILLKNKLIRLIEKYNTNISNPFYLWLDEDLIISEYDLFNQDINMEFKEYEDSLLDVAFNIHNELRMRSDYIDPGSYYHIFSICIFFRNSPISIAKF